MSGAGVAALAMPSVAATSSPGGGSGGGAGTLDSVYNIGSAMFTSTKPLRRVAHCARPVREQTAVV